jgi:predicted CXXCH cytochrome family protein
MQSRHLIFAMVLLLPIALAQEAGAPAILAPQADTVVQPGAPLRVIARAAGKPQLLLDGKPITTATSPAPGVLHAEINASAGPHELTVRGDNGESRLRFTAGGDGANIFRPHPPGNAVACDTCHAVKEGVWAMKRITLAPLCGQCHDRAQFPKVHTHNTDILTDCQNCHLPHGSAAKSHLQKPKEVVCKQCHS